MTAPAPSDPAAGPLAGVKVLDLTSVVSGPFATQCLADQGADVIKVEPPAGGDQGRYVGAGFHGYSALFATCNRNKRSLAIDLKTAAGQAAVRRIAARVDVVIENFRPGVADRLGLGYEDLRKTAPEIIYASITGYGQDGPYADRRVYDSIIQAASGLADSQGGHSGAPVLVNSIIFDKVAGATAAQAITAALFARGRGQGGRRVLISMLEASLAFNWPDLMWNDTFLSEDFKPGLTLADTYRLWKTLDGYIAIVFITGEAFHNWRQALDVGEPIASETFETEAASRVRWRELFPLWEARIAALTTEAALARFQALSVPCGPVLERHRITRDPQVRHMGSVRVIDGGSRGPMRQARPGARFSGFEPPLPRPAPELGGQSREILEAFGIPEAEIEALVGGPSAS